MDFSTDIKFSSNLISNSTVTITYSGSLFKNGAENVTLVYGYDNSWAHTTYQEMSKTDNGFITTFDVLDNFIKFNFCFKDNNNNWDNNLNTNYCAIIEEEELDYGLNTIQFSDIISDLTNTLSTATFNKVIKKEQNIQEIESVEEIENIEENENVEEIQETSYNTLEDISEHNIISKEFDDIQISSDSFEPISMNDVILEKDTSLNEAINNEFIEESSNRKNNIESSNTELIEESSNTEESSEVNIEEIISNVLNNDNEEEITENVENVSNIMENKVDLDFSPEIDFTINTINVMLENLDKAVNYQSTVTTYTPENNFTVDNVIEEAINQMSQESRIETNQIESNIEENVPTEEISVFEYIQEEKEKEEESNFNLVSSTNQLIKSQSTINKVLTFTNNIKTAFKKVFSSLPKLFGLNHESNKN